MYSAASGLMTGINGNPNGAGVELLSISLYAKLP